MSHSFLNRLQRAFESTFTEDDEEQIIMAMKHVNFLGTPPELQNFVRDQLDDRLDPAAKVHWSQVNTDEFKGFHFKGFTKSEAITLTNISRGEWINDDATLERIRDSKSAASRISLFQDYFRKMKEYALSQSVPMWWVSDRYDFDSREEADSNEKVDLIQKLGLVHWTLDEGEWLLKLDLQVSNSYKPTWIDAGLSFIFDSAPCEKEWGWTRDLASGKNGSRERIVKPDSLVLEDVKVWRASCDIDCRKLCLEFRKQQIDSLQSLGSSRGGSL